MLDTHVVVWLCAGLLEKIPPKIQLLLNNQTLYISQLVILELEYLFEIKRISANAKKSFDYLNQKIDLKLNQDKLESIINNSLLLNWTRDPFDRLIVANAMNKNTPLVTKDRTILKHYPHAVWDFS